MPPPPKYPVISVEQAKQQLDELDDTVKEAVRNYLAAGIVANESQIRKDVKHRCERQLEMAMKRETKLLHRTKKDK